MQLGAGDRHGSLTFVNSFVSLLGLLALFKSLIPREWWNVFEIYSYRIFTFFSVYGEATINEVHGGVVNEIYDEAELYVMELVLARAPRSLALCRGKNEATPSYALVAGESVVDTFEGAKFIWKHHAREREQQNNSFSYYFGGGRGGEEKRSYSLRFHKMHQGTLFRKYLEHVRIKALELGHQRQQRMLCTNQKKDEYYSWRKAWKGVPFKHPSSFSSIAMNPELKRRLMDDLTTFRSAGGFYRRVGRAWKRGYLLYGPPGTGKSSLIAAMANFTGYDVYDLELTAVSDNSELRKLLMAVPSKTIIVIEDIDCSLELKKRGKPAKEEQPKKPGPGENKDEEKKGNQLTLSGLLNFTDGLWSSSGEQRIFIFTTNFVELLDPALLRPGRMDFHIHMSYCCFEAFKVLAFTHLEEKDHPLFEEIREFLPPKASEVEVTPADIAEALVRNRDQGTDVALQWLLGELKDPNSNLRQKKVEKPTVEEEKKDEAKAEAEDTTWLGMSG